VKQQPIEIRGLTITLAALAILFAGTTVLAHWYQNQRLERAASSFQRGSELAREGQHERAIEQFRNALAVSRESAEYRLALARSLMALGRYGEAALQLSEVLKADPAEALPNLLLARIAASQGKTEDAYNYYHRAVYGYWPSSPEANRLSARWELVDMLAKTKQTTRIVSELLGLADESRDDTGAQQRIARMLLDNQAPTQAAQIAEGVIKRDPKDFETRTVLGRAEMELGNYQLARDAFRRALAYNPKYEPARENMAVVNEVLSLDPTLRGLGAAERYRRSRDLATRALSALEQCLKERLVPPETADLVDQARQALAGKPVVRAAAAENNIALAEELWQHRTDLCGPKYDDEPVARVLARIAK